MPKFDIGDSPYISQLKKEKYPPAFQAFTWYDENLRMFLSALEEQGLPETTDLVITGDHLIMAGYGGLKRVDRNLTMIFPWRRQDEGWKRGQAKTLSLYDLPPTVLGMLGVEYSPEFPWGANAFGNQSGKVPTNDDLRFVYGLTTGDRGGQKAKCLRRRGFCVGNEV
jgi:phosphoglycerol transferase MdoB-like AlkP superfamily enzyme